MSCHAGPSGLHVSRLTPASFRRCEEVVVVVLTWRVAGRPESCVLQMTASTTKGLWLVANSRDRLGRFERKVPKAHEVWLGSDRDLLVNNLWMPCTRGSFTGVFSPIYLLVDLVVISRGGIPIFQLMMVSGVFVPTKPISILL